MSLNQGEFKKSVSPAPSGSHEPGAAEKKYSIVVVSRNILIHQALEKTLQHFIMNGRNINVYAAVNLDQAQKLADKHPDIILVVIDNDVQVNGSYSLFVDYIKKTKGNNNCCITFKENLFQSNTCERDDKLILDEHYERFFHARERLIDITRMVMMTTEMENKINETSPSELPHDHVVRETLDEDTWLTKEKLNTVMAHDLKEPLANIKVMLDFLTNEPELLDQETSQGLLQRVKESANNIHELLEDYLFWSRMFRQEIYFNPGKVDMGQVVRENLLLLKSTAAAKNISLHTNVPERTHVFADEYMINTVIRNLVYNAIKFTPNDGNVSVISGTGSDMVEIRVIDNGIGISPENLGKLFRTDVYLSTSGTQKETGAGLGLTLCKDFIEKNGGSITIESEENKGSTFIFTLPAWSFAEQT